MSDRWAGGASDVGGGEELEDCRAAPFVGEELVDGGIPPLAWALLVRGRKILMRLNKE